MEKKLPKDFFWGGSVSSFQTEGAWDEGGKGLSIYDVRPNHCRTFPFWDYFKENEEEVYKECPAIRNL